MTTEKYTGACAIQDKCNDYADFVESIMEEIDNDDDIPCPIKCEHRVNPNVTPAHINPGTDTTINPVIINDTHRQKQQPKAHTQRLFTEDELKELIQVITTALDTGYDSFSEDEVIIKENMNCWIENKKKERVSEDNWDPRIHGYCCATHTPAHPPEAQQRIEQVIKELENDINRLSQRQQTQYKCGEISEAKRAIALLQAGRK